MFENSLEKDLKTIFNLSKVTFNLPGSYEKNTGFIEIDRAVTKTSRVAKRAQARVYGRLVVFVSDEDMPYGFISKRIDKAPANIKARFFFTQTEENIPASEARLQNLYERHCNFIYFYREQFDPNQGELTTLILE